MTLSAITALFGFPVTEAQRNEKWRLIHMGTDTWHIMFTQGSRGSCTDMIGSGLTVRKYIPLVGSFIAYKQWKRVTLLLKILSEIKNSTSTNGKNMLAAACQKHIEKLTKPTDRVTLLIYKVRLFMEMCGLGLLFLPLDLVVTTGRAVVALYRRSRESKGASNAPPRVA